MYAQFFGNYLLSKRAVSPEQLIKAIEEQHTKHTKIGTLAVHMNFMDATQVNCILIRQTHENKRFGELAIEAGFLTKEQVDTLLHQQVPIYLQIGQGLVENGALTDKELYTLIASYQEENELSQLETASEQQENLQSLIQNLLLISVTNIPNFLLQYLTLLFNDLIRFIGEDFTPLNPMLCSEYVAEHCSAQIINGEYSMTSYLDLEEETAITFASRYVRENFHEYDEYVQASIEDFLNLHNGLFNVNISNEKSIELELEPPVSLENTYISSATKMILMPIIYPFGTLNFFFKI